MWTRKQLKERGRASFKANYWKCLLVALLLGIITTSGSYSFPSFGGSGHSVDSPDFNYNNYYHGYDHDDDDDRDDDRDDIDDDNDEVERDDDETEGVTFGNDGITVNDGDDHVVIGNDGISVDDGDDHVVIGNDGITVNSDDNNVVVSEDGVTVNGEPQNSVTIETGDEELDEAIKNAINGGEIPPELIAGGLAFVGMMIVVTIIISLVIFVISLLFDAFLFNPIELGCNRFFYKNLEEPAHVSNVLFSFDHNYLNIVKVMFLRDLFIFLWSLLCVVPGIIKSYEYRMIPYILADNPEMSKDEAFALSKKMMDGQKWNAFVLDLSFIGWELLSVLTCGLLSIFYVDPYRAATNAALYEALKINDSEPGTPVVEPVTPAAEPVVEPEVVVD